MSIKMERHIGAVVLLSRTRKLLGQRPVVNECPDDWLQGNLW